MIDKKSKIFVAGHNGLVGSAIVRKLREKGYKNIITIDKSKLDLTDQSEVFRFLKKRNRNLYLLQLQKQEEFIQIINLEQNLFIVIYQYKIILFMPLISAKLEI